MSATLQKIIFCFLLFVCLWLGGLLWFIEEIPVAQSHENDTVETDAIVVLTGGSNRLDYGLMLLAQDKGDKLFISGVHDKSTPEALLRHVTSPELRAKLAEGGSGTIVLGHEAENTIGNAEETSRWLKNENYHSIRLVTANYHMPRSLVEFRYAIPDLLIVPEPVFPDDFKLSTWWMDTESRRLVLSEYHKFLACKLRHWIVSATREA